jgi:ketosteroid isomerase-like protein
MTTRWLALVIVLLASASRATAQTALSSPNDTAAALVRAIEAADVGRVMETFAEDATVFMPGGRMLTRLDGKAQIHQAFESLFRSAPAGSIGRIAPRDQNVQTLGEIAIVTFHLGDARLGRRTLVLRRSDGKWLIVHLHASNVDIAAAGDR